jgi:hypothetical protein
MATVRFATTCDKTGCTARSHEYSAFHSCDECMDDTCPAHQKPGSADDETMRCVCLSCAAEGN